MPREPGRGRFGWAGCSQLDGIWAPALESRRMVCGPRRCLLCSGRGGGRPLQPVDQSYLGGSGAEPEAFVDPHHRGVPGRGAHRGNAEIACSGDGAHFQGRGDPLAAEGRAHGGAEGAGEPGIQIRPPGQEAPVRLHATA